FTNFVTDPTAEQGKDEPTNTTDNLGCKRCRVGHAQYVGAIGGEECDHQVAGRVSCGRDECSQNDRALMVAAQLTMWCRGVRATVLHFGKDRRFSNRATN